MSLSFKEDASAYDVQVDDEPLVTSEDPMERKLARKLRIERRWNNVIRKTAMEEFESPQESNKSAIQMQVQKSAEILERFLEEAEEYVTNVRVANDSREVDRIEVEGIGKEKIIAQLEAEANAAHQVFEEIAVKWSVIQKYNDPLHINEDIANQKEKCELLIKQKDGIIAMLREELKKAEAKFTKDQKKQSEDINNLAERIEKQITLLRETYQNEFELVEEVIASERQNFIDSNNKKWEELYKKRNQQEIENSNKKFEQLEEFNNKMSRLRVDFQEKFRETKIKLENDAQNLQKELERIKALALLNSEKLDYNYQILRKREDENLIIKSQQKRRMNKLQDIKNELRRKIADYETTTNNNIKKFIDDIKKLHQNILDIEAKADHFAKVNDEKFHQIWELNRKNCQAVLTSIISTDKILHEQQMGIDWDPPPHHIIQKRALLSYKEAVNAISNTASVVSKKSSAEQKIKKVEGHESTDSKKIQQTPEQLDSNPIYRRLLKYILTLVSDKTGFLTEKRLKMLLKVYEDNQKTLVTLDNVFTSLDIHRPEDIDILVKYFIPYCFCPVCSGGEGTESTLMSRYTSQMSHFSAQSRTDIRNDTDIIELDEAYGAIRQPDEVIEEVVLELVTADLFTDQATVPQESPLDQVCGGGIVSEQFYSDMKEKRSSKKKTNVTEEKVLCQYNHPLIISSMFLLVALKDFVAAYYKQKKAAPTTRERLDRKRNTVSRLLSDKDIRMYWDKYRTVYSGERVRIWEALLEGLKNYHEILKDRKTLCEEVVDLRRQNEDLKRLLANYIDHGEFLDPPCVGASIQISQCEIILAQYFKLKHTILAHITQAVTALGFIVAPIVVGHEILKKDLLKVVVWYQAIILQGLILNLTFKKPAYLKSKQTSQYNYISSNPDDEEDIFSKNSRELQIKRQDSTGTKVTIEKHPISAQPIRSEPSTSNVDEDLKRNWETFEDDEEKHKYEIIKQDWETFDEDEELEGTKKEETLGKSDDQKGEEIMKSKNLQLELSFAAERENNGPTTSISGLPMPLFSDIPVNNNNTYSYDVLEQDPESLSRPVVFMPNVRERSTGPSSLEILKQPTFYKSLLTVVTTKFSIFVYYTLFPSYLYQELASIRMTTVSSLMGILALSSLLFSGVSYWINIERKRRAVCLWFLCWVGSFGYIMMSDSVTSQVMIFGAIQVTLSIATLQYVGMPLLGLTLRGETNKEFNLISIMSGSAFIFFLIIDSSFKNCFRLMALLHFFTGTLWFSNFVYKKIMK
ncbi:hypothetical protein JTB14_009504 [Gonioctena quinquepunctata]|nr:hypothetical protein JTB14_009504 [Gonioctena quinquepunctata]